MPYTALDFHKDCLAACRHCPQFREPARTLERHMMYTKRGSTRERSTYGERPTHYYLDARKVFSYWNQDNLLWGAGYARYLPARAQRVFTESRAAMQTHAATLIDDAEIPSTTYYDPDLDPVPFG